MKKTALLLVASLLLISCGGDKKKINTSFELKGTLSNAVGGETIYLEELSPTGKLILDSTKLDEKGNFSFERSAPAPGFYRVKTSEANFAMLILDSTQKIKLTGDLKDLGNTYTVEGSPDTKIFLELNDLGKIIQTRIDSFQQVFQVRVEGSKKDSVTMAAINKDMEPAYMKIIAEHQKKVAEVVSKNTGSLAALAGIQQLTPDEYMDIYKKVYADLSAKYPNSKYLANLKKNVEAYSRVSGGSVAPDFTLNTPEGKPLALSSLRGKIVMIDFWASWCGPCRKENPNVYKVYKKFHDKGFDILAVSLDDEKGKWLAAIEKDGLPWHHVSDLKGWDSEAAKLYGVDAIPFTVLLDKEGKIIGKGLRGSELEDKLEELFK
jgi:thiol-disulfide isomerase/thioredoxin